MNLKSQEPSHSRISLARLPTPIQKLRITSTEIKKEVYLWRDDLNGMLESGNKLRKLEFLIADALAKGCDTLITCGGPQSNHTRATTLVARSHDLDVSILILPRPGFNPDQTPNSNWLINRIFGANLRWLDFDEFQKKGLGYQPYLDQEYERLKKEGKKPYIIPLGGSNPIGCLGYRSAVTEVLSTWKSTVGTSAPDEVFCTLGSGGTFVGLQWGLHEHAPSVRLHGVNVIGPIETAKNYVEKLHDDLSSEWSVDLRASRSSMIDGYVGAGYSIASDDDLRFYSDFAQKEGVLLDPCYTGKAFQGMITELKRNPDSFGNKILFLHSGGTLGTFAYADQYRTSLE